MGPAKIKLFTTSTLPPESVIIIRTSKKKQIKAANNSHKHYCKPVDPFKIFSCHSSCQHDIEDFLVTLKIHSCPSRFSHVIRIFLV